MQTVQLITLSHFMKMTKYFFAAILALSIGITACEKKADTSSEMPADTAAATTTTTTTTTATPTDTTTSTTTTTMSADSTTTTTHSDSTH